MGVMAGPAVDFLSNKRLGDPGAAPTFNDTGYRMVANRVISILKWVEYDQTEIAGAVRRHRKAPLKFEITTFGSIDSLFEVTSQTQVVSHFSQKIRFAAPVRKMATLASKPVDRSVSGLSRHSTLVLVAGQADSATRHPQKTFLARSVGRVAIDTLGDFQRCVWYRRALDLALQVCVAGITQSSTPTFDQCGSRSKVASGAGVFEWGVDRAGRKQRPR